MISYLTKPFVGAYSPRETTNSEEYKRYFDQYVQPVITKRYLEKIHNNKGENNV